MLVKHVITYYFFSCPVPQTVAPAGSSPTIDPALAVSDMYTSDLDAVNCRPASMLVNGIACATYHSTLRSAEYHVFPSIRGCYLR